MKKLKLMSLLILVPFILGVILLITGGRTGNSAVEYAGALILQAGLPLTMFVLVVVALVLMITGRLDLSDARVKPVATQSDEESDDDGETENVDEETENADDETENVDGNDEDDEPPAPKSGAEREREEIQDINSTYGYANRDNRAAYMSRHAAENYRSASFKSKVLGWVFFGFLMTDFALIIVFAAFKVFIGAAICFCLFGGTILISLVVTVITQKLSMRKRLTAEEIDNAIDGTVQSCVMSSSTSMGDRRHTHITSVVYKVTVTANDREYTAYSKQFYDKGETVKLVARGNKRLAMIVDPDENYDTDDGE